VKETIMKLVRRIRQWLRWRQAQAELREEMDAHREMKERAYREAGLGEREARARAARELGNVTLAAEDARAVWLAPWLESLWQDARYGLRALRRQPGFTAVAVIALALGIGLNTSVFTVFNAVALRPWPVRNADRLVTLARNNDVPTTWGGAVGWSVVEAQHLRQRARSLSGLFVAIDDKVMLDGGPGGGPGGRAFAHFVSGDYFQTLGVGIALGRGFAPDEDQIGAPRAVVVLSHDLWQSRFGGDSGILGRAVRIDDVPFTVVGVAAEGFAGTSLNDHDLWIPIAAMEIAPSKKEHARAMLTGADQCCVSVTAVLAPGVTRAQAAAELSVLHDQFSRQHGRRGRGVLVGGTTPLSHPGAKRKIVPVFVLMFVGVGLVLLLACANVANLLIARAAARQREIAVRLAIGAGRARLVRQLMVEGLLLAGLATALGLVLAWVLPGVVFRAADEMPPASIRIQPDATVVGYACLIAVLATLVFALAPALHGTRAGINEGLKQPGWLGGARFRLRAGLLAVQIAVSVVLLVACALTTRGVARGRTTDLGFDPGPVVAGEIDLPAARYDRRGAGAFMKELLEEVKQAPGASEAAITAMVPLGNSRSATSARTPAQRPEDASRVLVHHVSGGYFDVLGIPLVSGARFAPADDGRRAVVINEALARQLWPGGSALGKPLVVGEGRTPNVVIGVVRDTHTTDLDRIEPTVYRPFSAGPGALLVRTTDADGAAAAVRALVQRKDRQARLSSYPLAQNVDRWLRTARTGAGLAAALGLLALALASVGVFGVVAYAVEQRTREIGIRMALGATRRQVVRHVLATNTRAVLVGLAAGLVLSSLGSRLLESYLFGVSRLDPVAHVAVLALLALAGLAATVGPLRRATRIDPMHALRWD
jgi:predicted permease